MDVALERARAVDAVTEAIALVGPQAAEKDIEIVNLCANGADAEYVGDEDRVRQIVVNLLSNAVKFTEPGGRIRVSCGARASDGSAAGGAGDSERLTFIRVEDTGIGIAEEELKSMFRPFEQVEKGRTRIRGGTGLGLTISRQLARLMGGDLTVESELGVGSAFTVWLRTDPPVAADGHAPPAGEREGGDRPDPESDGVAAVGSGLASGIESIMARYRDRLRRDPEIPGSRALGDAELEAHAPTLLVHIAGNLISAREGSAAPADLVRERTQIQRVIAQLHGVQRARLGWSEAALERELAILREEIGSAAGNLGAGEADVEEALGALARSLEEARAVSSAALREARGDG